MPLFSVSFEKTFDLVVEAESLAEAQSAVDDASDWDIDSDLGGRDADWTSNVHEIKSKTGGTYGAKPDSGIVDGEIVHIDDYRKAMNKRAAEETDDAKPHVPDKNQMSLPLPPPP